jgi:hypothetical protein
VLNVLKKMFFWNYARNTWQWDALCVLILIFIFLTPQRWFQNGEPQGQFLHQNPAAATLLVPAEVVGNTEDKEQLQQYIRRYRGRENSQVVNIRRQTGPDGKTVGYEVDIR